MIMQTIRMYDQLDMKKSEEPGIHLTTNKNYIPVDESNLVYRAAKLMMDTCGITEGVSIHLHKVIPVAAGMAGGKFRCSCDTGRYEPAVPVRGFPKTD